MINPDGVKQAESLFGGVFLTLTSRRTEIRTLRALVEYGLPRAREITHAKNNQFSRELFENPKFDEWFFDREAFRSVLEKAGGLSTVMTAADIALLRISVDAASLVFMHSALDAAVTDLCRVCSLVASQDWEPFISKQKVSLEEVKAIGYADLLGSRLTTHLESLSRESLLKRIDRLFELCRPSTTTRPGYAFDRARVETIDRERQEIVHGEGLEFSNIDETLDYLLQTGLFLFGMVNERYKVRFDPNAEIKTRAWATLAMMRLLADGENQGG
jgi:hypothetical protein